MKKYIDGFKKYRFLLAELVKKGVKLKYRRSYLGIVWSLLEPLLTMVVLVFVFGSILGRDRPDHYPVYVLCGRLFFSFFSGATKTAMRSIRANSSMIKKVYVPKYLYPLSTVIYNYIIFALSLIVLAAVSVFMQVPISWHVIECLLPLLVLLLITYGISMILATVTVFFRDVEYLWDVLSMLIMYCSAVFYQLSGMSSEVVMVIKMNPIFGVISNFRCALIRGQSIFTAYLPEYGGNQLYLFAYSFIFGIIVSVIGTYIFYKNQDKFILHI